MIKKRACAVVFTASLALFAAACGSDSKSASTTAAATVASTQAPTTAAGSSVASTPATDAAPTTAGEATTASPATGTPLKFYVIGPSEDDSKNDSSQGKAGVQAAVKEINDAGGIAGHPLSPVFCGDGNGTDQNKAAECARNATGDKDVSAVVWATTNFGAAINPILEQAGMACVGCTPFTQADFTSPNFFATTSGALSVTGLAASAADVLKAEKIALIIPDVPTAHGLEPLINSLVLGPRGKALDQVVYVPLDAVDVTAQAAQLAGEDAIINTLLQSNSPSFVSALRQQGSEAQILTSGGVYGPKAIGEQFGDNANGIYVDSVVDRSSDGFADYEKAMDGIGKKGSDLDSEQSTQSYMAVQLFSQIATQLKGEVTPASVLETIKSINDFSYKGLTPPIDFTKPGEFGGGHFPTIRNDAVMLLQYQDGELEPQGTGFTHIFGTG
jgi:branched-chain amino acid transport system substrate-binding protein